MHIQNEVHAKQLTEKVKILKDRHVLLDKQSLKKLKWLCLVKDMVL
ncbi:hypothetical protein [Helicobacter trogontum]|uniref:Uncharacterized protein n=1 Tax=Helicobacter trogontum TaxID=50960 RepID=A0ABQ0D560_9HELI|nr:hypothetical protein [Helicobacter trogontum]MCI5786875.1 hypothetical protein [Helicobacter trogontum]MDY5185406.1 hypothetical protein [Helicobacter trogontum]